MPKQYILVQVYQIVLSLSNVNYCQIYQVATKLAITNYKIILYYSLNFTLLQSSIHIFSLRALSKNLLLHMYASIIFKSASSGISSLRIYPISHQWPHLHSLFAFNSLCSFHCQPFINMDLNVTYPSSCFNKIKSQVLQIFVSQDFLNFKTRLSLQKKRVLF